VKDDASSKAEEMRLKTNQKEAEMTERLREKAEELRQYQSQQQRDWSSKPSLSESSTIKESRDVVDASDKLARTSIIDKSESGMTYTLNEQPDVTSERAPSLGGFRGLRHELGGEGDGIRLAAMSQDFSEL